jgi:hypothetical protein
MEAKKILRQGIRLFQPRPRDLDDQLSRPRIPGHGVGRFCGLRGRGERLRDLYEISQGRPYSRDPRTCGPSGRRGDKNSEQAGDEARSLPAGQKQAGNRRGFEAWRDAENSRAVVEKRNRNKGGARLQYQRGAYAFSPRGQGGRTGIFLASVRCGSIWPATPRTSPR